MRDPGWGPAPRGISYWPLVETARIGNFKLSEMLGQAAALRSQEGSCGK
jgi:hypothetical protein